MEHVPILAEAHGLQAGTIKSNASPPTSNAHNTEQKAGLWR